jgi:hypothetical protein
MTVRWASFTVARFVFVVAVLDALWVCRATEASALVGCIA